MPVDLNYYMSIVVHYEKIIETSVVNINKYYLNFLVNLHLNKSCLTTITDIIIDIHVLSLLSSEPLIKRIQQLI